MSVLLRPNPGGISNGKLNVVPSGMITSCGIGFPAGQVIPLTSGIAWFGMNPAGRISCLGMGVFGEISNGLDTPPSVPQQVDVISLAKSQFYYLTTGQFQGLRICQNGKCTRKEYATYRTLRRTWAHWHILISVVRYNIDNSHDRSANCEGCSWAHT